MANTNRYSLRISLVDTRYDKELLRVIRSFGTMNQLGQNFLDAEESLAHVLMKQARVSLDGAHSISPSLDVEAYTDE